MLWPFLIYILDQVTTNAEDAKVFAARNNPTKNRSSDFLPGVCVWSSLVCRFKKGSYYTDNAV